MKQDTYSPGLDGIVAGETGIARAKQGELLYRGYEIEDLAAHATFEEVAYLLLYGELPNREDLGSLKSSLFEMRTLSEAVLQTIRLAPNSVGTIDVLRSAVSMAGHFDSIRDDEPGALQRRSLWLAAQIAGIVAARNRVLNGLDPVKPKPGLSHTAQILYQTQGVEPDPVAARLLDLSFILYAEHEFNASTFAARVICSTQSDMVSAVAGAIGALKGPLHGGANEAVTKMLTRFKNPGEAHDWVRGALTRKEKVMGFGHRVYKDGDHRAPILERELRKLASEKGASNWISIYDAICEVMEKEKKIYRNLDYPSGLTYFLLGLPIDLYTPLFAAARVTGWCAHYIEQWKQNRLYRPLSRYTGPDRRPFIAIDARGG